MKCPWQYKYIEDKINCLDPNDKELIDFQLANLPHSLIRFYPPDHRNVQDVLNQRLRLSDPTSFNDPFDCKLAFNQEEYIKYIVINYIVEDLRCSHKKPEDHFTREDLSRIYRTENVSHIKHKGLWQCRESLHYALLQILGDKSDKLKHHIGSLQYSHIRRIKQYIEKMQKQAGRIACFCTYNEETDAAKINLMWSHYAVSHSGFCVEYNLEKLKEAYMIGGHHKAVYEGIIKNLLPVHYTTHRIHIPKTISEKIAKRRLTEKDKMALANINMRAYITKSNVWKYENEWRLMLNKEIYDDEFKIFFPFAASIHIGTRASENTIKELIMAGKRLGIPVRWSEPDDNKFEISNFDPYYSTLYKDWEFAWQDDIRLERHIEELKNTGLLE